MTTCFVILIGKMVLPKNRKVKDLSCEIKLQPIDEWEKLFKNGDSLERMKEKVLPWRMLTEQGLNNVVINGIQQAADQQGIYTYKLERNDPWIFLIGKL